MIEKNMTALVCCFARAYHFEVNKYWIFKDSVARQLLSSEEYNLISKSLTDGILFFNKNFKGTKEEALRYIIDNQISPSVLARSIFAEEALKNAVKIGCQEYLLFASGYDTFGYRNNLGIKVFEIDRSEMIKDKKSRIKKANIKSDVNYIKCDFTHSDWDNAILKSNYDSKQISFSSLLGITYYLTKEEFEKMIQTISKLVSDGSSIVFDYPSINEGIEAKINSELAASLNEEMKAKYTYSELESLLAKYDFLIYEHLDDQDMNDRYFTNYNTLNSNHKLRSPQGIHYCLAVKKKLNL